MRDELNIYECEICNEWVHPEELIMPEDEYGNQECAYHKYCYKSLSGEMEEK